MYASMEASAMGSSRLMSRYCLFESLESRSRSVKMLICCSLLAMSSFFFRLCRVGLVSGWCVLFVLSFFWKCAYQVLGRIFLLWVS